jgi:acyl-CoA reductase-like NAD-dependent aldehyde dehydrogenase
MPFDVEQDFRLLIGGRLVAGARDIAVINPARGEAFAAAPAASEADLDAAVAAARAAFPAWAATPFAERVALLRAVGQRIAAHAEPLKHLLTREQGKPHADALFEVLGCALWCEGTAALELTPLVTEDSGQRRSVTTREPIGVVGAIVPWNFPLLLAFWKIAPALLAGNTIIVKPAPTTPLTTLKLGELLADSLPPGVLNIVSGDDQLGPWMTAHHDIDKISFTGSSRTGQRIMASAAGSLKRLTLELGGNDPAVVLPDVDIAQTARDLFWAAFRNSGQICIAAKRLYIHDAVYDELAEALTSVARGVRMGDGADAGVELGPVQNSAQYERVANLIADSRRRGHRFLCGGEIQSDRPGYFIPVTIVDRAADEDPVVTEEAFGPLLPLLRFKTNDEAVARANAGPYGLGASVWSRDLDAAQAIARQLDAGTVWINEAHHATPLSPFAGHKQSGVGVENGLDGLLAYTQPRTIHMKR